MKAKNEAPDLQSIPSKRVIEARGGPQGVKDGKRHGADSPGPITAIYQKIIETLADNIGRVEFGEAGIVCKIHGGRIASVCYSVTDNRIEKAVQK